MQGWLVLCALAGLIGTETCRALPPAASDEKGQREQLIFYSEGPGQIDTRQLREPPFGWVNSLPAHMTYQRVHGGIGP
jgi:hypothetical protein